MYQKNISKHLVALKPLRLLKGFSLIWISGLGVVALEAQAMQENPQRNQNQGFVDRLLAAGGPAIEAFDWLLAARAPTIEALMHAAKEGDIEQLRAVLRQGLDVNSKDKYGYTPLHAAVEYGQGEAIRVLIEYQANLEAQSDEGYTPLHWAAWHGQIQAINVLREHQADLEARSSDGHTPLHAAARNGQIQAIEALMEHQADLEARSSDGRTPLHWAAALGQVEVIEKLLQYQANLEAQSNYGHTPLHWAAWHGRIQAINVLMEHQADLEARCSDGRTPLHCTARIGEVDVMSVLLWHKANLEAQDNNGDTPLHWAAEYGQVEAIIMLLAHGANLEAQDNNGDTPLHWAARNGQAKAIKVLLAQGANLAAQNRQGQTPLELAMQKPRTKKLFTENINKPLYSGSTILGIAVRRGNTDQIQLLVRYGAKLEAEDARKVTAMQHAIECKQTGAVRCLSGLKLNKGLLAASKQGDQELTEFFLNRDADINARDAQGYTPLLLALKHGHMDLAWELIKKGADAKAISERGDPALHFAIVSGHPASGAIVRNLVQQGFPINRRNEHGETALHLAAARGQEAMVEYLLEKGADSFLADHEGRWAIHRAAEIIMQENYAFVRLILRMLQLNDEISADEILRVGDNRGNTVLHIAARIGNMRILALCAEYAQDFGALLRIKNTLGDNPYELAIGHEQDAFAERAWLADLDAEPARLPLQQPSPSPSARFYNNDPRKHWSAQLGLTSQGEDDGHTLCILSDGLPSESFIRALINEHAGSLQL